MSNRPSKLDKFVPCKIYNETMYVDNCVRNLTAVSRWVATA